MTDGALGTVTIGTGGDVTYTPNSNENGTDTFTYTVTSGGVTETQTVTVTILPVSDLVGNNDNVSTNEDVALIMESVAGNDSTTSDGTLTYALVGGVASGTLIFNSDGSFNYTPDANFNGPDSFTYTVTDADSGESATQSVNITVNPVVDLTAADDTVSGDEDTVISGDVSANDLTTSDGTLTFAAATSPANGSVTVNGDGTFNYTPNLNFNGTDSFTYTVTDVDSGETATQTVDITINPVVDLTAADDTVSGDEDTVITGDVSLNDSTISGGALTFALATSPGNGSVSLANDGTFAYTPDTNFFGSDSFTYTVTDADSGETATQTGNITVNQTGDVTAVGDTVSGDEDTVISGDVSLNDVTISGGLLTFALATGPSNGSVAVNANGTFDYTPNLNFNGTDSFTYNVTDVSTGETATQTVDITVNPVVDLTAADDAFSGDEDTAVTGDVSGNDSTISGAVTLDLSLIHI